MVETFNPAPTANLGETQGIDGKVIAQSGQGQPAEENLATKDPSATLLEGSQAGGVNVAADGNSAELKEVEAAGMSYTEMGLLAGAFVAGAVGQKYGLNRQALAMAGRGLEATKTAVMGATDLAPYARFVERNADIVDKGLASRLSGWLTPGRDIIDRSGQVFMHADGTVVATNNLSKPNVFTAVNKYGDVAKFQTSELGVHSIANAIGRGPINGFAISHETPIMTQLATTTIRDGNKFARVMKDGGVIEIEGRGLFTEAQLNAAIKQGQQTTSALYDSIIKTKKVSV